MPQSQTRIAKLANAFRAATQRGQKGGGFFGGDNCTADSTLDNMGKLVTFSSSSPRVVFGETHGSLSDQMPMSFMKSGTAIAEPSSFDVYKGVAVFPSSSSTALAAPIHSGFEFNLPVAAGAAVTVPSAMMGGGAARAKSAKKAKGAAGKAKKAPKSAPKSAPKAKKAAPSSAVKAKKPSDKKKSEAGKKKKSDDAGAGKKKPAAGKPAKKCRTKISGCC